MGYLLKIKCVDSRVNGLILSSISVSFRLTQVPNLAPTHTKRITVRQEKKIGPISQEQRPHIAGKKIYIAGKENLYAGIENLYCGTRKASLREQKNSCVGEQETRKPFPIGQFIRKRKTILREKEMHSAGKE
jgi:hypothetical protein